MKTLSKTLALGLLAIASIASAEYNVPELSITPLGSGTELKVGRETEIGKFRLSNPTNKDIYLQSIRFRNYGKSDLRYSLSGPGMYVNNQKFSADFSLENRYVTFTTPYFTLGRGDSMIISVRANAAYARTGDSIQLGIQHESDFKATFQGANFGVRLQNTPVKLRKYDLNSGSIYASRWNYGQARSYNYNRWRNYNVGKSYSYQQPTRAVARTNPTRWRAGNSYVAGSRDVIFLRSYMNNKATLQAQGIFLTAVSSQASDKDGNGMANEIRDFEETFSDFRLYMNGQSLDSTNDFSAENGKIGLLFDTGITIEPGTEIIVSGRVSNSAVSGDKLKLRIDRNALRDPEYVRTGYYSRPTNQLSNRQSVTIR